MPKVYNTNMKNKSKYIKYLILSIIFLVLTILAGVLVFKSIFANRSNLAYTGRRNKSYSLWLILIPLVPCIVFFILYKINKNLCNKQSKDTEDKEN